MSEELETTEPTSPLTQLHLIKPEISETGDARVDAALGRLADTVDLPVAEQIEVFEEVHRRLMDALAEAHG